MNAISMNGHYAQISDACRGCGRCVEVCAHGAIELTIEGDTFMQQTIESLSKLVNIS
jgi:Fe-S-cluster-containing hydrogenase component 2